MVGLFFSMEYFVSIPVFYTQYSSTTAITMHYFHTISFHLKHSIPKPPVLVTLFPIYSSMHPLFYCHIRSSPIRDQFVGTMVSFCDIAQLKTLFQDMREAVLLKYVSSLYRQYYLQVV